jgi:hypothetical protein
LLAHSGWVKNKLSQTVVIKNAAQLIAWPKKASAMLKKELDRGVAIALPQ